MNALPRSGLLAVLLLLIVGCATRSGEVEFDPALIPLGRVSAGGSGPVLPGSALKTMLQENAARQYGVPVDEVVVGHVDIEGSENVTTTNVEYMNAGVVTVEVPTGGRGASSWHASAEVRRKPPQRGAIAK